MVFWLNGVVKWVQNPSRVPGTRSAAPSRLPTSRIGTACDSVVRRCGVSCTRASSTPTKAMVTSPATRNVGVQPGPASNRVSGSVAARLPTKPSAPVSAVTSMYWRAGKWFAATRSTETKVSASPTPSTARASRPSGYDSATASRICPSPSSSSAAVSTRRGPNRSTSTPVGICIAAYTPTWSTVNVDSAAAPTPKRSAASSPATPSEVRWNTART